MALSVVDYPQGRILDTTEVDAEAVDFGGVVAIFKTGHGLSEGNYVYVVSALSAYNGYWYVNVVNANNFRLKRYATADSQEFIKAGDVSYYKALVYQRWQCVHLPIVYKLKSTLWPTNSDDTIRTVSSISDDAGYVNLNLSGDIKATGSAAELEFVQVFGQNAGIYQIINWISDSDITIDFPYSAGVSFAASTVQYYYKDYHARIKVYAGLVTTHEYYEQNPIEEIVTIKAVPDADGIISVNIADFVKSKIRVDKNDSALATLPNDINSWCHFYIQFAEAYTYSTGYTLGTLVGAYTDDSGSFVGFAVNAKLPFKSINAGYLTAYNTDESFAGTHKIKFLTTLTNPEAFQNQYYDISFILNVYSASGQYILEQYFSGDTLMSSTAVTVNSASGSDTNEGVYRHRINFDSAYTSVKVSLYNSANTLLSEIKEIKFNTDCTKYYTDLVWKNHLGGHDYWRFNAGNQLSFRTKKDETKTNIFTDWPNSYGAFADTIEKNSSVEGKKNKLIRSQFVTKQLAEEIIQGVENALLVQIQTSQTDRLTVLVQGSNQVEETDKLVELQFRLTMTDDVPTQSL